jgi:hypothetical protein
MTERTSALARLLSHDQLVDDLRRPQGVAVFVSAMAKTLAGKVSRECDAFPANV